MTPDQFSLDRMAKDPGNWRGPFYGCSKDPRMFVEKSNSSVGWGWTLNCLNPLSWLVILGIILISVGISYL
jgi:uncharacterized membrane protein